MKKVTEGVVDVIVYPSAADKTKNRGFAFVEYESHRAAAMARRKLLPGLRPFLIEEASPLCPTCLRLLCSVSRPAKLVAPFFLLFIYS